MFTSAEAWAFAIVTGVVASIAFVVLAAVVRPLRRRVGAILRKIGSSIRGLTQLRLFPKTLPVQRYEEGVAAGRAAESRDRDAAEQERQAAETPDPFEPWSIVPVQPKDKWSAERSSARGTFDLTNNSAGIAEHVQLSHSVVIKPTFDLQYTPEWPLIPEGNTVQFFGRVSDAQWAKSVGVRFHVRWTDSHGDEQFEEIALPK